MSNREETLGRNQNTHLVCNTSDPLEKSRRTRLWGEGCQGYFALPAAAKSWTWMSVFFIWFISCVHVYMDSSCSSQLIHHNTTVSPCGKTSTPSPSLSPWPASLLFPSCSFSFLFISLLLFWRVAFARQPSSFLKGFFLFQWFPASPSLWVRHSGPLTPLCWFTQAVVS